MLELLQDTLYHLEMQDERFKDHNILTEDEMYRHGQLKKKITRGIIQQLSRTIFEQFVTPPSNTQLRVSSASTEQHEQGSIPFGFQDIQQIIPSETRESIQNCELLEEKTAVETVVDIAKNSNDVELTDNGELEVITMAQTVVKTELKNVDDNTTNTNIQTCEPIVPENTDFLKEPIEPLELEDKIRLDIDLVKKPMEPIKEEKIRLEIIPADEFDSSMSIGEQVIVSNSDEGFSEDDLMGTYQNYDYEITDSIDETSKGSKENDLPRLNELSSSDSENIPIHEVWLGQDDLFNTPNFAEENDLIDNVTDSDSQENLSVLNAKKINGLYSCNVCAMTFRYKHGLLRHSRVHTGEKPFKCLLCPATFSRKDTLETHHRVHTGEKPFECTACGNKYAQRSSLRGHLIVHQECKKLHKKKPYDCKSCRARFTKLGGLNKHIKRKHPEDKNKESEKKLAKPKRKIQLRRLTEKN